MYLRKNSPVNLETEEHQSPPFWQQSTDKLRRVTASSKPFPSVENKQQMLHLISNVIEWNETQSKYYQIQ